jgi:uncharacterized membrane protein YgcG
MDQLNADLDRAYERIRKVEKEVEATARLAVFTARDLEEVRSRLDLVVFVDGELKSRLSEALKTYSQSQKVKREQREAEAGDMAVDSGHKPWKVLFCEALLSWVKAQLDVSGPRAELRATLGPAVERVCALNLQAAVVSQRFTLREAPPAGKAWMALLHLDGGESGRCLYEALAHTFAPLYRKKDGSGKTSPAELGCKPDRKQADRPLTAEVALIGELEPRTGKGKGKGKAGRGGATAAGDSRGGSNGGGGAAGDSSGSTARGGKRPSPEPGRGGAKRR